MKVINPKEQDALREDAAITECMLEIAMPPAFFDIMIHLPYEEIDNLTNFSPVNLRWMYPIECMNKVLRRYVKTLQDRRHVWQSRM